MIFILFEHITSNEELNKSYNYYNQKYSLDELLVPSILILMKGLTYGDITNYTIMSFLNVYKFIIKLENYKIINYIEVS